MSTVAVELRLRDVQGNVTHRSMALPVDGTILRQSFLQAGSPVPVASYELCVVGQVPPDQSEYIAELEQKLADIQNVVCDHGEVADDE